MILVHLIEVWLDWGIGNFYLIIGKEKTKNLVTVA